MHAVRCCYCLLIDEDKQFDAVGKPERESFSCCFGRRDDTHFPLHHSPLSTSDDNPAVIWIKAKGPHDHSLSEIKDKCLTILGLPGAKHKRQVSVEFRYDPLSYGMNRGRI
ncbi:hypothetical protein SASPL_112605 [Salvia splendens]|uniref:Uncharacterized protein n=1 Tax=Salvia splendens TaxID=180675 RepID=A0A8X9A688_SALSN|nr:hypothetical protein SASPL_112605 [Salvia splendens]